VGSLVLITEESFPEYGVWHHQQNDTHMPSPLPFPQAEISGREIFTRLVLEPDRALGNMGMNWNSELPRGAGVTVAGVSGTPQRAGYIADLGSGLVENMEGFSLALGAAAARIPFVELRAISNKAGQRPPHGWDMTAALAALGQGMKYLLTPLLCGNATARDASASP
jgi:futalosine hydrolase